MKFGAATVNDILIGREAHYLHDVDIIKIDGSVEIVAGSLFNQRNIMVRNYNNLYLKTCGTQRLKIVNERTYQYDDTEDVHPISTRMVLIVFVKK